MSTAAVYSWRVAKRAIDVPDEYRPVWRVWVDALVDAVRDDVAPGAWSSGKDLVSRSLPV